MDFARRNLNPHIIYKFFRLYKRHFILNKNLVFLLKKKIEAKLFWVRDYKLKTLNLPKAGKL